MKKRITQAVSVFFAMNLLVILIGSAGIAEDKEVTGIMPLSGGEYSSNKNDPKIESDIDLREMFTIPSGSDSYIHSNNPYQVVITKDQDVSQQGQLWYNYRVDLEKDFKIESRVHFGDKTHNEQGGDGMTFTIHNDPRGLNAIGSPGGGIGIGHTGVSSRIINGFALEFDTYYNNGDLDRRIRDSYNQIMSGISSDSGLSTTNHLVHMAVQELPMSGNHKVASIYKTDGASGVYESGASGNNKATVHSKISKSSVMGQWHDLNISWDASTYSFTFEVGNEGSPFYTCDTYQIQSESELNTLFGFTPGGKKLAYWGYTGACGSPNAINYQSVAIKGLPSKVQAEATKEAGLAKTGQEYEFSTESVEASIGKRIKYRSMVTLDGENSDVPLANIHFEDTLDELELDSEITIEWFNAAGNRTNTVVIPYNQIDKTGNPANYTKSMGRKAYLSSTGILSIYGLDKLGGNTETIQTESMQITYEAIIKTEAADKSQINNTEAVFYSGTKEGVYTNAVPINILPSIILEKKTGEESVYLGEEIEYTLSIENENPEELWEGEIRDVLPSELIFPKGYSALDVSLSGSYGSAAAELNGRTLTVKNIAVEAGKTLEIKYRAKVISGSPGQEIENKAYAKSNVSGKEHEAKAVVVIAGEQQQPVLKMDVSNESGMDSEETERKQNKGGPTYVLDRLKYEAELKNPVRGTKWEETVVSIKLPEEGTYIENSLRVWKNGLSMSNTGVYHDENHSVTVNTGYLNRGDEYHITYEVELGREDNRKEVMKTSALLEGKDEESIGAAVLLDDTDIWPPDQFGKTGKKDGDVRYRRPEPKVTFRAENITLKERTDGITRVGDRILYTYTFANAGSKASVWETVSHVISMLPGVIEYEPGTLKIKEPGKSEVLVSDNDYYNSGKMAIETPALRLFGTSEGESITWTISFYGVLEAGAEGKKKEELGITGKADGYGWIFSYDQGAGMHTSDKEEIKAQATAWLEEMEEEDQVEKGREVLELIIPKKINYGSDRIRSSEKWYEIQEMEFTEHVKEEEQCIGVWDARKEKGGWKLNASLVSPMKDEETGTVLHDSLVFCDGAEEYLLKNPEEGSVSVASKGEDQLLTNVSGRWYQGTKQGLYLKIRAGQGMVGRYKAVILWELEDVPD